MKRYIILIISAAVCLCSCKDFLTKNPESQISPADYFKTEADLQLFTNAMYEQFSCSFDEQSDILVQTALSAFVRGGNARTVPASGSGWSWGMLRRINALLGNADKCTDEKVRTKYVALTRFFRAYFYSEKLIRFGAVPWIDKEMESDSPELYAPRDNREFIITKILEDLDYAIENLPATVSTYRVNAWAARAMKSRICLFEGTLRKYMAEFDALGYGYNINGIYEGGALKEAYPHDANYYLELSAKTAKEIMEDGPYQLASDYLSLFAQEKADAGEFILAQNFSMSPDFRNNTTAYGTMPTQGCPGLTKKFVDSFLMKDGTRFTDKSGWETMTFVDEMADRDPRLACLTRCPGYTRIGSAKVEPEDFTASSTGFQVVKFVMDPSLPEVDRVDKSYNDLPLFRLGEVYLNYAEALAELGTLTQADLDASVNKLRARVNMPAMNLAQANANPDPYMCDPKYGYINVTGANKGVILEIRRERTIELYMEGFRLRDLIRWREGKCMEQKLYGPYFPAAGEYDLTGDAKTNLVLWAGTGTKPAGYKDGIVVLHMDTPEKADNGKIFSEGDKGFVDPHQNTEHIFNEARDYFFPVPTNERTLNRNLTQNHGWDDGLDF